MQKGNIRVQTENIFPIIKKFLYTDLYAAQRACFLDPSDPQVQQAARAAGIPQEWVRAAERSPVWKLISRYEVALPLHPEYRTMPMVWYIPPLSPVVDVIRDSGHDAEDADNLFAHFVFR